MSKEREIKEEVEEVRKRLARDEKLHSGRWLGRRHADAAFLLKAYDDATARIADLEIELFDRLSDEERAETTIVWVGP